MSCARATGAVLLLMLLVPELAWAIGSIGAVGQALVATQIEDFNGNPLACICERHADFDLSGNEGPPSVTVECPSCSTTCTDPNGGHHTLTVRDTINHADVSGGGSHVRLNANGSGGGSAERNTDCNARFPNSRVSLTGDISFVIASQSEAVNISVSGSVSGNPDSNVVTVALQGPSGPLGVIEITPNGTTGSIPSGVLPRGSYSLHFDAIANSTGNTTEGAQNYTYSLSVDVTGGVGSADVHWHNPNGGNFGDAANWNPQQVPTSLDHAIFDLPVTGTLIPIQAGNVGVGRLSILGSGEQIHGSVQVLNSGIGFEMGQHGGFGGALRLDSGATLLTSDGVIGSRTGNSRTEPTIFVIGQGTRWTVGPSNPLQVGFLEPAFVVVDQAGLLNAQKEIDIGALDVRGHLEVHNNALVTSPFLNVGNDGGGSTVLVDSGGAIQLNHELQLGDYSQSLVNGQGVVTIAGISSDGTRQSSLTALVAFVGGASGTEIEVKDGGLLDASASSLVVGENFKAGSVHVHGTGGSFPATVKAGVVIVGSQLLPSELVVEDGGAFNATSDLAIAQSVGDIGTVTVSNGGTGFFHVAGDLHVGTDGQGTLNISSGGKVTSGSGDVPAALEPGTTGTTFGKVVIIRPLLRASPDSEWDISGDCMVGSKATGLVNLLGMPALFTTTGATLNVGGTLTVGPFGTVFGNGKLVAGNRVVNGGFISPGLSPGVIEIDGNYEQTADGLLKMEAAGLNAGQLDVLHVTGISTLGGILKVLFLDGYLPRAGDVMPFFHLDGRVTGSFRQIIFPQLVPGFQASTQLVNGVYKLTALNNAVLAPTSLLNISTRMAVGTGDNVLIGGFILQGSQSKRLMIRGIGPSLSSAGVPDVLADPTLELHDSTGAVIARNDNWNITQTGGIITADQTAEIVQSEIPPTDVAESAIVATLRPGAYTAIMRGKNNTTGVGLVEVYDLSAATPTKLANISTRGLVQTHDNIMIGGLIVGNQRTRVVVRAIGPSLTQRNVPNALQDPTLELHNGEGTIIASNDNWKDTQETAIHATGLAPTDDRESAILTTLTQGNYTAIVRGKNNTTGVALVEVYNIP